MWTGRQTLTSIEDAIAKLNGEESQLDIALHSAVSDAERLRTERSQSLRELARVKLDEMAAGRLVGQLDAGERRALQILEGYRLRISATVEQCDALQKEVAVGEVGRHAAAAAVEAALEEVDKLRADVEIKVHASSAWRDAKCALDQAEAIAGQAEKKADASEAELGAKKKPYDEDPLFVYLWRRKFGTTQYAAGKIARIFDRMIAEFIDYSSARPNYGALLEIPLRLREHAIAKRKAASETQSVVAELERHALVEAGIETKEKVLTEARHKLAMSDDTVEKKRALLSKVNEERAALVAGGNGSAYGEALDTIAAADTENNLTTLYAEARRTATEADDAIVGKLESIETKIRETETQIDKLRREALDLSKRRAEIEKVRERFRGTGYDHPQIAFDNTGDISNVLKGVLEGAVRSGVLWDILRQGHRSLPTRGNADFGAPDFPLPFPLPGGGAGDTRGGGWRNPSSQGGWLPGPRESRSDDDNFTTGGSF
jgi:hypothetical protein